MDTDKLTRLLTQVQTGQVSVDQALDRLRALPYDDIGYARLDVHRPLRQGLPEVVFCQNKTIEQATGILERLWQHHDRVLATRVSSEMAAAIRPPRRRSTCRKSISISATGLPRPSSLSSMPPVKAC